MTRAQYMRERRTDPTHKARDAVISAARSRALNRLARIYPIAYYDLYLEERNRLALERGVTFRESPGRPVA